MKREKEEGGEEDERAKCKSRGSLNEISKRGEKKKERNQHQRPFQAHRQFCGLLTRTQRGFWARKGRQQTGMRGCRCRGIGGIER